jgi:hypothetical protein
MPIIHELTCPYINKIKAAFCNTLYYCDFDNMEFDSMKAHCKHCEMYENLMKKAGELIHNAKD